jgi:glucodextranase-like protein
MNNRLTFCALMLIIAACSPTPTVIPSVATLPPSSPTAVPTVPQPEEILPTNEMPPTATSEPSGALWLQVLSPQDETVVDLPQVDVTGTALAGAVVSINEEVLVVGNDGQFKATIPLEEGPNLIEVLASDAQGNETSLLLTVTYEP